MPGRMRRHARERAQFAQAVPVAAPVPRLIVTGDDDAE